jgi:lipopolysaccharide export system permease protein
MLPCRSFKLDESTAMRLSSTLSLYIGRQFLFCFLSVVSALMLIVFLFDVIEMARRAASRPAATMGLVMQLSLLKLPKLAQELAPFVVLFATMIAFFRLARTHELTVVRAAGVSVWQFLLPVVTVALLIGGVLLAIINPLSAVLYARYELLEAELFRGQSSLLAVSPTGVWLRQADGKTNSVVHALRVAPDTMILSDVIIFTFEGEDKFVGRVDATTAELKSGHWLLRNAQITTPDHPSQFAAQYELPTDMTRERIQDGFGSPETISFWDLPAFIRTLEAAGFSATRHRMYWHRSIAGPLLLFAMVLLAATFSLRPPRRGGAVRLIMGGIASGFVLFFLTNLVAALGQTQSIPVALAAWAPTAVSTLLGVSFLLHLEDG